MFLTVYSILISLSWIVVTVYILLNTGKIRFLKNVAVTPGLPEPGVAVIIAAKDEQAELAAALQTVCNLDYSNYRIFAINDRSTDNTPTILRRLAASYPSLSTITIEYLPEGWLGKNNALYQGYRASTEEWLLFTDADIHYQPQALKKAIQYALANSLDHLTALPEITSASSLFKSVMNTFSMMLELRLRPWDAANPSSNASIGVGAFNLVKRAAYEKAGTHAAISLRPDDDLKLGENIKKSGLQQDVVYGEKEISLKWYNNLSEFIDGLMKNAFSISNYHFPTAIIIALLTLVVFVMPIPVLLLLGTAQRFLAILILLSQILLMVLKKGIRGKWWHALLIPFAGAIMIYIIVLSAYKTLKQGGIYWRGSFYPLEELKKQR